MSPTDHIDCRPVWRGFLILIGLGFAMVAVWGATHPDPFAGRCLQQAAAPAHCLWCYASAFSLLLAFAPVRRLLPASAATIDTGTPAAPTALAA